MGCYVYKLVYKNRDFRPISRFISETTQDMAITTMEDNRNLHSLLLSSVNLNGVEYFE